MYSMSSVRMGFGPYICDSYFFKLSMVFGNNFSSIVITLLARLRMLFCDLKLKVSSCLVGIGKGSLNL